MIFSGESVGRDSLIKKKAHTCHVFVVSTSKLLLHQLITFTSEDGEGVSYPFDDPMVIMVDIDGLTIRESW